jgi:23S rRNA pseudouridine1911/1915/1917 synthase
MDEPKVIYENKDFLVINKPAGLMVHAVKVSDKGHGTSDKETPKLTLADWLVERYPEIKTVGDDPGQRPGIVHRLDKDTSGVMLIARNQASFEYLKSLFQKHEIRKTYRAVVWGILKKEVGTIDVPIGILTGSTRRSVHSAKMAKEAVTEYRVISTLHSPLGFGENKIPGGEIRNQKPEPLSLLNVFPKTGRTHQIRVHLASIGHPIVGDKLYGRKSDRKRMKNKKGPMPHSPLPTPRLMLHALSVAFTGSDGRKMLFEAEEPREFKKAMEG